MRKILLGFILLLTFSIHIYAKPLWQATRTGMTVEQVQKIFPNANKQTAKSETTLGTGAQELLKLDVYKIGANYYGASFYFFPKKGLSQVTLTLLSGQDSDAAYTSLVSGFRAKYGREAKSKDDMVSSKKIWITKERSAIELSLIATCLSIIYDASDVDDDRLDLGKI